MSTRCKFQCQAVKKMKAWRGSNQKFVYEAEFTAVTTGTEEDMSFFEATPSGTIKVGTYKNDVFEPGKTYYVDFEEAPE